MPLLDRIERAGNALPDPVTLFAGGAFLVMLLSHLAVAADWEVVKTVVGADGAPVREAVRANSLLSAEGAFWALDNLVGNFKDFPPLAIVLVGMLGIGLADRTGFVGALLKAVLMKAPNALLTPTVFLVGVLSSLALDAGYIVLPPVAAALYAAVGRSPLAGLAAVFAGVSAGFSANLVVTSLDTVLMGFSTAGAHILDENYNVVATANLYFMQASTLLLMFVGWATTAWWVEPRLNKKPAAEGGPPAKSGDANNVEKHALTQLEKRGLSAGVITVAVLLALFFAAAWIPGAPLYDPPSASGEAAPTPRWVMVIIPLIFIGFFAPGLAYGIATKKLRSDSAVAKVLGETMSGMGPYIVLAFFAAQFVEFFRYSGLGEMLAISGGQALAAAALPAPLLMLAFIFVVMAGNLFVGSMSAKYAFFAPVFVPMFMAVGISPELTQAAYRVGDSITNVITPLNPYLVIILVFLRQWVPGGGIGTLLALMVPYAFSFTVAWCLLLTAWMLLGIPLGPGGPLVYAP